MTSDAIDTAESVLPRAMLIRDQLQRSADELLRAARQHDKQLLWLFNFAEAACRKLQVLFPTTDDDLKSGLYWMANRGTVDDIALLGAVKSASGDLRSDLSSLIDAAIREITQRLQQDRAQQLISALLASPNADKKAIASELYQLGVRTRPVRSIRNPLVDVSESRIPQGRILSSFLGLMRDSDRDVCSQVALALAEWAGRDALPELTDLLRQDCSKEGEEAFCSYLITALEHVGGEDAVEAIRAAAESGSDPVRVGAIHALQDLVLGTPVALHEGHPVFDPRDPAKPASRAHNAIVDRIQATLRRLAGDQKVPEFVREEAKEALAAISESAPAELTT
jgi:hypothetical protein